MSAPRARLASTLLATAIGLAAGTATAVDGVTEINDTSITAAGGYPFAIGASGSYVITSNLAPPVASGALVVAAANVEIDLNGFSILGSGGGAGAGIDATGFTGLTVRDGMISGMGGPGITGATEAKFLNLHVTGNGASGIVAAYCVVVESTITTNVGSGVMAAHCKIENNVIRDNGDSGIDGLENVIVHNDILGNGVGSGIGGGILCFEGCTIHENVLRRNFGFGVSDTPGAPPGPVPAPPGIPFLPMPPAGPAPSVITKNLIDGCPSGIGIYTNISDLISENTVTNHFADGIVCGASCTVLGNQVHNNNLPGTSNGGMTVGPGSTVNDNSISFNTGIGLVLSPTASYASNTLTGNTSPLQDMSLTVPPAGAPHPSSGFFNSCGGGPAPNARCP